MVAEADRTIIRKNASRSSNLAWLGKVFLPLRRLFGHYVFSSLTRRILVLNLAALGVLVSGILYLNQFREGLIDARVESLMTQGEIIAAAIAASATVSTDSITIDPEKLLELQAGQTISPSDDSIEAMEFPINPERVAPVLRRLISPTRTRARIYDRDANLMLDSQHLYAGGQVLRFNLPAIDREDQGIFESGVNWFMQFFRRNDLPIYQDAPGGSGAAFPEVMTALTGSASTIVRMNEQGCFYRGAGAAVSRGIRRTATIHAGVRHRPHRPGRAPRYCPGICGGGICNGHSVNVTGLHDCQSLAPSCSRSSQGSARRAHA
jgi:two-component system, OmpR family, sensor histidine kinase ChvG